MVRVDRTRRRFAAVVFGFLAAFALGCSAEPDPQPTPAGGKAPADDRVFQPAARGAITQTLVERGTVEATRQTDVVCRVRGVGAVGTIKWVVDDGTFVKKGDRLVELDDAAVRDRLRVQEAAAAQTLAAVADAGGRRKVVEAQVEGGLKSAEGELEVTRLAAKQVADGEAGRKRKLELRVEQARERVALAKAADPKSPAGGRHAVRVAEADLEAAEIDARAYAGDAAVRKRRAELRVEQAKSAFEVAKLEATGKRTQAEAAERAARTVLEVEDARLRGVREDLGNCVLLAPADGLAVYPAAEPVRAGSAVIAPGEPAREGQKLLTVVDLREMQIRVRVPEAWVARLRPAAADGTGGQAATVRVDAFPDRPLAGRLRSVAAVAAQADWLAADVKVYPAVVSLDGAPEGLKPGMTTEVVLLVAERKDVLRVPVQAVVTERGGTFCHVRVGNDVEKRKITPGLSDARFVEVKEGLKEDEPVLLNPRPAGKAPAAPGRAGSNLRVRSVKPPEGGRNFVARYGLTDEDLARFEATVPGLVEAVPVRTLPADVRRAGSPTINCRVVATRPSFAKAHDLDGRLAAGRFLADLDEGPTGSVAVLGAEVAAELFPEGGALGATVTVAARKFVVVGVLSAPPAGEPGVTGRDVYLPLATFRASFGEVVITRVAGARTAEAVQLTEVVLVLRDAARVGPAAAAVRAQLEQSHSRPDWEIPAVRPGG